MAASGVASPLAEKHPTKTPTVKSQTSNVGANFIDKRGAEHPLRPMHAGNNRSGQTLAGSFAHDRELFVKSLQEKGLAVNSVKSFENFELAIGESITDIDVLGAVVIFLHGDQAGGTGKADVPRLQRFADLVHIKSTGFFDRLFPEIDAVVGENHGAVHGAVFLDDSGMILGLEPLIPPFKEGLVSLGFDGHEIGPATQFAHEVFGRQGAQFILGQTERNHGAIGRGQTSGGNFLEEGHVGITVDGIDHTGVATGGELFDLGHVLLVVGVAKRSVFAGGNHLAGIVLAQAAADVIEGDTVQEQILVKDEIGGLRIYVIRADEVEFLFALGQQIIHRRRGLLIDGFGGVKDVLRQLLAFILHRIEEHAVILLKNRQDGLTTDGNPAAENDGDFVFLQKLLGLLGE